MKPIKTPSNYVPGLAVAFDSGEGQAKHVSSAHPLPVTMQPAAPPPPPIKGEASADMRAGPFVPAPGGPVMLTLSGQWTGEAVLLRSTDGGKTLVGLTAGGMPYGRYTTNVCEPVWEEARSGAQLYLQIRITSGTLSYEMGQ